MVDDGYNWDKRGVWIVVSQVLAKCYSVVVVGIAGKEGREVRKGKM